MKKILLSALLAMAAAPVISQAATEVNGNVSMNGSLLPQTCIVSGNGGGADFTVNTGDVSVSELNGREAGTVIRTVTNSIQIRLTGCSQNGVIPGANGAVRARFDGTSYLNRYLFNTGTARGINVSLINADGSDIAIGATDQSAGNPYVPITGDIGAGSTTLVYGHKYVRNFRDDTPAPGTIRSTVQYTIEFQ